MGINHLTNQRSIFRDGTGNSSTKTLSKTSDTVINLAIPEELVHVPALVQRILLSSTFPALIPLPSITANAVNSLHQTGPNYCESNGFQQRSHARKLSSLSIALKPSTNLLYKGRRISMTTTTPFYGDLIMPISPAQL